MKNTCLLSTDAKTYLCCYYRILDEMIQSMTTAGLTQSISRNFAVQMIPSHRAAIQMSDNLLRFDYGSGPVRRLARQIVEDRTQGIADMESAMPAFGALITPPTDLRLYQRRMDLIYREMYAQMGAAPEHNRLAAVFLAQMIRHHQGAVRMAEHALKYDIAAELVPILRSIVSRQRQETAYMRSLLRRAECQSG